MLLNSHKASALLSNREHTIPSLSHSFDDYTKNISTAPTNGKYKELVLKNQRRLLLSLDVDVNENVPILSQLADIHFANSNYGEALKIYKKVIFLDPNNVLSYRKAIQSALMIKNFFEVDKIFRTLVSVSSRRTDFLHDYVLFRLFAFNDDSRVIEEVIKDLEEMIRVDNDNSQVLNTLGLVYLKFKSKREEAKDIFELSIKMSPKNVHPINNLGVYFSEKDDFTNALKYFHSAIAIDRKYLPAYENVASIYIKQKKLENALDILESAKNNGLTLSDDWQHHFSWLLLENKRFEEAIRWYSARSKIEPQNDIILNNLGVCYKNIGKIDDAKYLFLAALKILREKRKRLKNIDSRSLNAFYNLGKIALEENNLGQMKEIADELWNLNKSNVFSMYLHGHVAIFEKKYKDAKSFFDLVLKFDIAKWFAQDFYTDYSYLLECIEKKYEETIKLLENDKVKSYQSPQIKNNLAYAYAKLGKLSEARTIVNEIDLKVHTHALATLGLINLRDGNWDEGNKNYKEAIHKFEKKSPALVNEARQVWLYEQARYLFHKKETKKALTLLKRSMEYGHTYLTEEILALKESISLLSNPFP